MRRNESADYFRSSTASGHLPSYDSAVYNQPPPSYEEAIQIKDHSAPFASAASRGVTATTAFMSDQEPKADS